MKIAVPVDHANDQTSVCVSFGRAPYFMIFDSHSRVAKYIDNSAVASQGGAGIKAAQTIVDQKADVLLTPRCGENAAEVLKGANILIYKAGASLALGEVRAYLDGKLTPLSEIHAGFHHHGEK